LKKYLLVFVIAFANSLYQNLFAQERFATIKKNVNFRASGLYHDLNKSKDTLLLKSDKKINHIYSINKHNKREINNFVNSNSYKLSLKNLSKGKHVFVVSQSPTLIVFVVHILKDLHPITTIDSEDVALLKN